MRKRIVFQHYKTGEKLVVIGTLPKELNHPTSDRYVVKTEEKFVDVIKSTVLSIEDIL